MTAGEWLDDVPLDPCPPHVRMGTRRLPEEQWLLVDDDRTAELELKATLLVDHRPEVVAVDPDRPTEQAQAETLGLVTDWLRVHHPDLGAETIPAVGDPRSAHAAHRAPDLERAARLIQEDLCLMAVGDGPPTLAAAVVCFPSHWRLADKIGRPMAAIHQPVPDYGATLGARPDRLIDGLDGERIMARRNWSVHDGNALFAPTRPPTAPLSVEQVPDRLWLRSERQTLRRLPSGSHVLFTIRVQQAPIGVLRGRPDVASRLAAAVRAEAPDRLDRLAGGEVDSLLGWLDRRAA